VDLAPVSVEGVAATLAEASAARRLLSIAGGGTRSRRGAPGPDAEILSLAGLDAVLEHSPADLTVTVQAGVPVERLAEVLADAGQMWPQADVRPGSTVGGVLATAATGRSRLRYGAVRDSLLEVVLATGDGRVVKGGARTVKAVSGYDMPRLAVGSMGTLGVIVQATLKLWPIPEARAWFTAEAGLEERLARAARVLAETHRPAAVLLSPGRLSVELTGTAADVVAPEGLSSGGPPPEPVARGIVEAGVPPRRVADLVSALEREGREYLAEMGVGRVTVAVTSADEVRAVRGLAAAGDGHAWVADGPQDLRADADLAWGPAPPGIAIMRRLKSVFDPSGILNPGRYVDGI
jgi:glycolate oxidase FAD binding subunit